MVLMASTFLTAAAWSASNQCEVHKDMVIDSEARCVEQGGISIGLAEEDGAKVACMESKEVQSRCGPDGRLTRLQAYTVWFNKLKKFENSCSAQGGTFSFQDPHFSEPVNESFCMQAIPEFGASMFEEPLCNFRSVCPAVTVMCERSCSEHTLAKLY